MKNWRWMLLLLVTLPSDGAAQNAGQVRRSVAIHWQRVPLRDALERLETSFDSTIFLDRRVDPNARVSLDIEASSVEEVLISIGAQRGLGVGALGGLVYLGPPAASEQLRAVAATRMEDVAELPGRQQTALNRKRRLTWPRLTEPRGLAKSLMEGTGWRLDRADRIPHDLWPTGELPELALAEQLTVLLIGFDLTFEIRPRERVIVIVPLEAREAIGRSDAVSSVAEPPRSPMRPRKTKQVYTLRVEEQPVGVVLRELSRRLNWTIEIDEEAIRAAGRTLDARVSFAVENVDEGELLNALLRPAELDFRREGERIKIVPGAPR
jgi:hypothetical protein